MEWEGLQGVEGEGPLQDVEGVGLVGREEGVEPLESLGGEGMQLF